MQVLILSGVGGSSNWLPLVLPLAGIVVIAYSIDFLVRYLKKRRLLHNDKLINELTTPAEGTDPNQISDL